MTSVSGKYDLSKKWVNHHKWLFYFQFKQCFWRNVQRLVLIEDGHLHSYIFLWELANLLKGLVILKREKLTATELLVVRRTYIICRNYGSAVSWFSVLCSGLLPSSPASSLLRTNKFYYIMSHFWEKFTLKVLVDYYRANNIGWTLLWHGLH